MYLMGCSQARNFRHRRKEYLTTLEDEISTRDTIISELQDKVGVIRAENTGLRTELPPCASSGRTCSTSCRV